MIRPGSSPSLAMGVYTVANTNTVERTYPTWYSFIRDASGENNLNPSLRSSRNVDDGRNPWHGTNTWQEALDLANRGWPEGLRRILANVHIIERFIGRKAPRLELVHSIQGPGILDMARYAQGRPDSWVVWEDVDERESPSTRIVSIILNTAASAGVSPDTIFQRGAAVCALVDILEHSKIRTNITLVEVGKYDNVWGRGSNTPPSSTFKVTLKRAEDVLDRDRLAFALCNASVPRRLMFSLLEQYVPGLPAGYGAPSTYQEEGAIVIDSASLYIHNEKDMVPWLVKQLAGFGIGVEA